MDEISVFQKLEVNPSPGKKTYFEKVLFSFPPQRGLIDLPDFFALYF